MSDALNVLFVHPNMSRYAYKQIVGVSRFSHFINVSVLCGKSDVSIFNMMNNIKSVVHNFDDTLPHLGLPFLYKRYKNYLKDLVDSWDIGLVFVYSMPDDWAVAFNEIGSVPVVFCMRDPTSSFSKKILGSRIFPGFISNSSIFGYLPNNLVYSYVCWLERNALEKSIGRVFASSGMYHYLSDMYSFPSDNNLVFSGQVLDDEIPKVLPKFSSISGGVHIGFIGNIDVCDPSRDFLSFFISLAKKNVHVHIFPVFRNAMSRVACKSAGRENSFLHVYDTMLPSLAIRGISQCDFGIIPFDKEKGYYDTILPNKFFDYITAGVPIVSFSLSSINSYISKFNLGFCFDNIPELVEKLNVCNPSDFCINPSFFSMRKNVGILSNFIRRMV